MLAVILGVPLHIFYDTTQKICGLWLFILEDHPIIPELLLTLFSTDYSKKYSSIMYTCLVSCYCERIWLRKFHYDILCHNLICYFAYFANTIWCNLTFMWRLFLYKTNQLWNSLLIFSEKLFFVLKLLLMNPFHYFKTA